MATGKWPDTAIVKVDERLLVEGRIAQDYPDSIQTTGGKFFAGWVENGNVLHGKRLQNGNFRFPLTQYEGDVMVCDIEAEYVQ